MNAIYPIVRVSSRVPALKEQAELFEKAVNLSITQNGLQEKITKECARELLDEVMGVKSEDVKR